MPPAGLEPATRRLEGGRSIQLSYGGGTEQYRAHAGGRIWLDQRMRAWMLVGAALGALVIAPVASGQGGGDLVRTPLVEVGQTGPAEIELDGDPALERVAARRLDEFRFAPRVEDDCLGARRLGPVNEAVAIEAIKVRTSAAPPLLWTSGSSGATGRVGHFRLHRLGPPPGVGGCPTLKTLFAFPGDPRFRLPRPPRGTDPGSFSARPRVVDGRLQIRTTEGLYRVRDAGCCPSFARTTDWRYDRERDRYVRARSRTRRLPSPG